MLKKMSLSNWVNCPVRLQFYISFTFIYKMSKIKTLLADSQPGYVLKILVNLSLNVLIKRFVYKKECNFINSKFIHSRDINIVKPS